jgi:hypothetical protein
VQWPGVGECCRGEALRLREQLGDRRGENLNLANLGLLCAAAGDVAEGRQFARVALDGAGAVNDAVPAEKRIRAGHRPLNVSDLILV